MRFVKYYRPNCAPCKIMGRTIEQYMEANPTVTLEEVNVNELSDEEYAKTGIKSVPTVKVYLEEKEFVSIIGSLQLTAFTNWIDKVLNERS